MRSYSRMRSNQAPDRNVRASGCARSETGVASRRVIVAGSLVLVLVGATFLAGARTTIGPLLQSSADARAAKQTGDIVYALPDGVYCRRVAFDNATAEIKEGPLHLCGESIGRARAHSTRQFAWGGH